MTLELRYGAAVSTLTGTVTRRLEDVVRERMQTEPVIVLHGARSVGKSTLLAGLAASTGRDVIDLDDPVTREAVAAGPGFVVGAPGPVFIDEYQRVPDVLDAIKAELNRDLRPGRFVLTGSTNYYTTIPRAAQSLTGRAHVIPVWPLSQHEIHGDRESFATRLLTDPQHVLTGAPSTTDRVGYAQRVLGGGFPIPLRRAPDTRGRWFADYVELVVERDVLDIRRVRQREVLPRFLRRLAAQTGQLVNITQAARAENLDPSVASDYTRLLEAVFFVHRLPAWGTTLGSRVNVAPKLHLVDTGVGGWLLDVTVAGVERRSPSTLTELGHLVETFVVNELLKQVSWLPEVVRCGHYRTHDGPEVDLVLQTPGGDVVGVEVKAGERVTRADAVALARLRDKLGDRFRGGIVLHTGPFSTGLDDRIVSAPIDRLWGAGD